MKLMDIAEVSRRSGIPASTLRYYDEKGIIESIGRKGLRRLFDAGILLRLSLITLGKNAGFTLEEIQSMFAPDGNPRIDRDRLLQKADQLDQTIQQLSAMRDGLRHAAECPAPSHLECPTFQRLLQLANTDQLRKARTSKRQPSGLSQG